MYKFFNDLTTKLANIAKDYNLLFSTVNILIAATYFIASTNNKIMLSFLLFILFCYLIALSSFGRYEKEFNLISNTDNNIEVAVKISLLRPTTILILALSIVISSLHVFTKVVIIKAAFIFIASFILSEGWTIIFKKQILKQVQDKLN